MSLRAKRVGGAALRWQGSTDLLRAPDQPHWGCRAPVARPRRTASGLEGSPRTTKMPSKRVDKNPTHVDEEFRISRPRFEDERSALPPPPSAVRGCVRAER